MNRHEVRKEVFKAVFMNEFHDTDDMKSVIDTFLQGRNNAETEDLAKNSRIGQKLQSIWIIRPCRNPFPVKICL